MGNQKDMFGDVAVEAKVKAKRKAKQKTPQKASSSGGGKGGLPPYFAPISGAFEDTLPLGRYASTQYLQYAIATVKDRALPRAGDGQKPVQSRILYAMWQMNAVAGTPRKKSAYRKWDRKQRKRCATQTHVRAEWTPQSSDQVLDRKRPECCALNRHAAEVSFG